jgi:hypothetical protein
VEVEVEVVIGGPFKKKFKKGKVTTIMNQSKVVGLLGTLFQKLLNCDPEHGTTTLLEAVVVEEGMTHNDITNE